MIHDLPDSPGAREDVRRHTLGLGWSLGCVMFGAIATAILFLMWPR